VAVMTRLGDAATRLGGGDGATRRAEVEAEAVVCFAKRQRGRANEMKGAWGREKKEMTDEYRRTRNSSPAPHIFVGGATSPMNICYVYKSVTWLH
jgi:hypothetical protein